MLNSLISRGPAGGDLPREGWESPSSFVRSTDLVLLPSFRHPFHPARFVKSEIYSKRNRNVYGRASLPRLSLVSPSSLPRLSLDCLHEAREYLDIFSLSSLLVETRIQNSRHRVAQKEEGGEGGGKKVVETFSLFESRTWIFCGVPLRRDRFEEDLVSRKRRKGEGRGEEEDKSEERDERKGRKEGRKEERRTTRRVSLMERNWNHLPCDRHGTSSPPELGSRPARRPPLFHSLSPRRISSHRLGIIEILERSGREKKRRWE